MVELYRSLREDEDFRSCSVDQQRRVIAFGRDIERQTIEAVCPTAKSSVIVVDGEPAGEIIVERTPASVRLIEIAIAPHLQGCGIGTSLVRQLCDEAADRAVPIRLRVAVGNVRARQFYQRHGFIESDADDKYVDLTWSSRQRL